MNFLKNTVLIRADGNEKIGLGHLVRTKALADEFFKNGFEVVYVVKHDEKSVDILRGSGFKIHCLDESISIEDEIDFLKKIQKSLNIMIFICDLLNVTERYILELKSNRCSFILLDNERNLSLPVDLIINGSIYAELLEPYKSLKSQHLFGLKYFILREQYAKAKRIKISRSVKNIMIIMGGSDPLNLTGKLIKTVLKNYDDVYLTVIVGKAYSDKSVNEIKSLSKKYPNINVCFNINNMSKIMQSVDIAISAGGTSLYELIRLGIPVMVIGQSKSQELSSRLFHKIGVALNLGYGQNLEEEKFLNSLKHLILYKNRKTMSVNSLLLLDGLGAMRCVKAIINHFNQGDCMYRDKEILEIEKLFDNLFPLCRSITGDGLRESFEIIKAHIPLKMISIPSGTKVFDWEIPKEWKIREAWIKDSNGNTVIDFRDSNLHVINYSGPIDKKIPVDELKKNIKTLPGLPDAIPYVTSYYKKRWGFCMTHKTFQELNDNIYHAYINSEFVDGSMDLGHYILPGETKKEIVLSSYICHPSLANNELSGPIALVFLYKRLLRWPERKYTYRFVLNPETIGSIAYLYKYGENLKNNMISGIVLTCLGGDSNLTYKKSKVGKSPLDRIFINILSYGENKGEIRNFTPTSGSDERQYCSPGFNLPMGQIARMKYGDYDGYHNSLDTKAKMGITNLLKSIDEIESALLANENNNKYLNLFPYGEVKLDKYGLYPDMNIHDTEERKKEFFLKQKSKLNSILNLLSYSDGETSLLDIADKCEMDIRKLIDVAKELEFKNIISCKI